MNPYKDSQGKNIVLKSFCAYFDILGFSEKINSEDYAYFDQYLTVLQDQLRLIRATQSVENYSNYFEIKVFTDNFVLGYPWRDEYGESELGHLFDILSQLQFNFSLENIFIRGAISLSDLFMDDNIVIGKALVEAYQLENKKALYPRIILSESVQEIVKKHIRYYATNESSPQFEEYLIDIDGQVFVNYLMHTIREKEEHPQVTDSLIQKHKETVQKNLENNSNNYPLFQKFVWIGKYHNYFCDTFLIPKNDKAVAFKIESKYLDKKIQRNFIKHL